VISSPSYLYHSLAPVTSYPHGHRFLIKMFHAVLLCLAAVLTAILPTTAEPDPVAGGQIIDKYTADGKDYTVYAFGQLVNSPSVPPPPPTGIFAF
jgi:hypothetical protein